MLTLQVQKYIDCKQQLRRQFVATNQSVEEIWYFSNKKTPLLASAFLIVWQQASFNHTHSSNMSVTTFFNHNIYKPSSKHHFELELTDDFPHIHLNEHLLKLNI